MSAAVSSAGKVIPSLPARTLLAAFALLGAFAVSAFAQSAPFGGRETDTAKKGPEKRKKRLFHKKLLSDKRQRNARILSWYFQGFQSRTKHGAPIRKGNR